jgi:hypothetical protein
MKQLAANVVAMAFAGFLGGCINAPDPHPAKLEGFQFVSLAAATSNDVPWEVGPPVPTDTMVVRFMAPADLRKLMQAHNIRVPNDVSVIFVLCASKDDATVWYGRIRRNGVSLWRDDGPILEGPVEYSADLRYVSQTWLGKDRSKHKLFEEFPVPLPPEDLCFKVEGRASAWEQGGFESMRLTIPAAALAGVVVHLEPGPPKTDGPQPVP